MSLFLNLRINAGLSKQNFVHIAEILWLVMEDALELDNIEEPIDLRLIADYQCKWSYLQRRIDD